MSGHTVDRLTLPGSLGERVVSIELRDEWLITVNSRRPLGVG
jgi:hypothetical protein